MFENQTLNVVFYILSIVGFGGMVSGIVVRSVGRKIDKSDKAAEERQREMVQCMVLTQEGIQAASGVAYVTANAVIRAHGANPEISEALGVLDDYKKRDAAHIRKNAAEFVYGAGGSQ